MLTDIAATIGSYFEGDQRILADPYPLFRQMREQGPIHRVDSGSGHQWDDAWHVFSYAATTSLIRDERMSAERPLGARRPPAAVGVGGQGPAAVGGPPRMMLTMDPPDHTRLRRLVTQAFAPRVIAQLRPAIEELTDDLLDAAEARGATFDLLREVFYPLPTIVIAKLLGIPATDWEQLKHWSNPGISFRQDPRSITNAIASTAYLQDAVAGRRENPSHDLIGALVAARDRGDMLSDEELVGQCRGLLVGGHETTSYALATATLNLLRFDGAWASLPDRQIGVAVEELLRFDAPFQTLSRRAVAEIEIAGQRIQPNDMIWMWLGAANHDPAQFAYPDDLDLARTDNRHLSFGLGVHFCLGAALARLEIQIALSALRARYPRLRLMNEEIVWRDAAIRGPEALRVSTR